MAAAARPRRRTGPAGHGDAATAEHHRCRARCRSAAGVGALLLTLIGVLAAITVPAYQDYTLRAKATQAIGSVAPLQTQIASFPA